MFKRKGGGGKGLLNNVQKNCTFLTRRLPLCKSTPWAPAIKALPRNGKSAKNGKSVQIVSNRFCQTQMKIVSRHWLIYEATANEVHNFHFFFSLCICVLVPQNVRQRRNQMQKNIWHICTWRAHPTILTDQRL